MQGIWSWIARGSSAHRRFHASTGSSPVRTLTGNTRDSEVRGPREGSPSSASSLKSQHGTAATATRKSAGDERVRNFMISTSKICTGRQRERFGSPQHTRGLTISCFQRRKSARDYSESDSELRRPREGSQFRDFHVKNLHGIIVRVIRRSAIRERVHNFVISTSKVCTGLHRQQ